MDSVKKDCRNCKHYSTDKNGFWEPICMDCSDESTADDPFPKWEYASKPLTLGDLIREAQERKSNDPVNHPKHYTDHPSGIECIQITEHMNFCLGNAIKYIWRAGLKSDNKVQDLEKAVWYIQREIAKESK